MYQGKAGQLYEEKEEGKQFSAAVREKARMNLSSTMMSGTLNFDNV